MKYVSTRGEAPELGFQDTLVAGLARDGGLYVPKAWPVLDRATVEGFAGRSFAHVAAEVVGALAGGEIAQADLERMAEEAYGTFGHPAVTPLVQIAPDRFVLELFHGPTLAFKDVAMQLLARLMDHVLARRGEHVTIVGATSGDTGGAAIEAFRGRERADVMILYPDGRVSDVQRRMMTTPTEANVHALALDGTFDDCQARVKDMFNHHAFRDRVRLSAVNSINWARIAAQITYYFVAGVALGAPHRRIAFVVPTGNFGDIFAGYAAGRMGLPVDMLTIATNDNDILARTLAQGRYETRGVVATTSPSMDIQVSSNFERALFEASNRDAGAIVRMMAALKQSGAFDLGAAAGPVRKSFAAASATMSEVAEAIRRVAGESGYVADPHTACALVALDKTAPSRGVPQVVLATAHPAKFPDAMAEITGRRPALPERLGRLMVEPERFTRIANDVAAIEALVTVRSRAARRPA